MIEYHFAIKHNLFNCIADLFEKTLEFTCLEIFLKIKFNDLINLTKCQENFLSLQLR